jgi:hypothetical protein
LSHPGFQGQTVKTTKSSAKLNKTQMLKADDSWRRKQKTKLKQIKSELGTPK